LDRLALTLSTFFGVGFVPVASGTAGALVAMLLALPLIGHMKWLLACTAVVTLVGLWASSRADKLFNNHDSGEIVIDEVSGMLLALSLVPASLPAWIAAFLVFRFFDITKPFPCGLIDKKVNGGLGVMADDWMAGLYAGSVVFLAYSALNP